MNSQIYCLPLKYGWNAMQCTSDARAEMKAADLEKRRKAAAKKPFFTVQLNKGAPDEDISAILEKQYPNLKAMKVSSDQEIINATYNTEYNFKFGPQFIAPYHRPLPPVSFEFRANPLIRRQEKYPPIASMRPPSCEVYDHDRGAHEWRYLVPRPGMYLWEPLQKIPFSDYVGERSTLMPARFQKHDPTHEKERWDSIRNLIRQNAISYGYRSNMPGYTGWRQNMEEITSCVENDVANPNLSMMSTTQAYHRQIPLEHSLLPKEQQLMKRLGADSRLVTMTQPHNPQAHTSACD